MKLIERDEQQDRSYIPLAGGYEFQTKGKGSTVRLATPNERHPLSWQPPHVEKFLEACMLKQHEAYALLCEVLNSDMAQREEDEGNKSELLERIRELIK